MEYIEKALLVLGNYGPILVCFVIVFESILPIIPLGLFVTLNFILLGNIAGFIVSWIFTIIGCMMSFTIFRKGFKNWFNKNARSKKRIANMMKYIDKLETEQLVLILAIPFTPAFVVNIAAGLSHISRRKYFWALVQGKIFLVYFWGFMGISLIESITNPLALFKVFALLIIAYIASALVNKKYHIE